MNQDARLTSTADLLSNLEASDEARVSVGMAWAEPGEYRRRFGKRLAKRGIRSGDALALEKLVYLALVDALVADGRAVEIDWRSAGDEVASTPARKFDPGCRG